MISVRLHLTESLCFDGLFLLDNDFHPAVFLPALWIIGAVRIGIGSSRFAFSFPNGCDDLGIDSAIHDQPLFYRIRPILRECQVIFISPYGIGVPGNHNRPFLSFILKVFITALR